MFIAIEEGKSWVSIVRIISDSDGLMVQIRYVLVSGRRRRILLCFQVQYDRWHLS